MQPSIPADDLRLYPQSRNTSGVAASPQRQGSPRAPANIYNTEVPSGIPSGPSLVAIHPSGYPSGFPSGIPSGYPSQAPSIIQLGLEPHPRHGNAFRPLGLQDQVLYSGQELVTPSPGFAMNRRTSQETLYSERDSPGGSVIGPREYPSGAVSQAAAAPTASQYSAMPMASGLTATGGAGGFVLPPMSQIPEVPPSGATSFDPLFGVGQALASYGFALPNLMGAVPDFLRPARQIGTVRRIQLVDGNLVVDCPVPGLLLKNVPRTEPENEYKVLRYTAVTCDPNDFSRERYTLRQSAFGRPTELMVVMTMYNEDDELFCRTMHGVMKNIAHLCSRERSKIWGPDGWKKVVVCIVADGRKKIDPRVLSTLAVMGCYQEGVAKNFVNGKEVQAHLFEYTTQISVDPNGKVKGSARGLMPVQILFCLKEKNAKKLNSHRWAFRAFAPLLQPRVCVLLDVGTRPGDKSIYRLWKAFDVDSRVGGACGEIRVMKGKGWWRLLNPLVASQDFEYKTSNILDKPMESAFGYISVLPGAFSAYRWRALQEDVNGQGPLVSYFKGEQLHSGAGSSEGGIFEANMYLAEDRILCFELVAKRGERWKLRYVRSAFGETDVPDTVAEFISQRRRWLNGSFFAAIYALAHWNRVWSSGHSTARCIGFMLEGLYMAFSLFFSWFALGNFWLTFFFLGQTMSEEEVDPIGHRGGLFLFKILEYLYIALLIGMFICSMGNRPQGSRLMYSISIGFFALIMVYILVATCWLTAMGIKDALSILPHGTRFLSAVNILMHNATFTAIVMSVLATYGILLVAALLYMSPWHLFTSFLQYLLLAPSYINVLNVYAFCNTHDVSWGTKGDTAVSVDLGVAMAADKGKDGGVNEVKLQMPIEEKDLDAVYQEEMSVLSTDRPVVSNKRDARTKLEDGQKQFRTNLVLAWALSNGLLVGVVTATEVSSLLEASNTPNRANLFIANHYFTYILYSVVGIMAFRFLGSVTYLCGALFGRGR